MDDTYFKAGRTILVQLSQTLSVTIKFVKIFSTKLSVLIALYMI